MLLLTGCAGTVPRQELPEFRHHAAPVPAEAVDPLAVTPAMEAFLDRFVRPYADPDTRVQLLARSIGDSAMLGFRYDERLTLTAAEAFERRQGNCVAYANLVVAMARASGLKARFQEIERLSAWDGTEETVLVPRHINVVVETPRRGYVLDTSGLAFHPADQRRRLSDAEALSAYHNNLGAEALLARDLATAYGQLARAIEVAPGRADPWVNLGVVLGRNAQYAEAEMAYLAAMARDDDAVSARSNLYEIYRTAGDDARADEMAREVERYRRRNPYHLLFLAETALEEGRTDQALVLLRRSIELKPEEARFHDALARAEDVRGAGVDTVSR
ncbi:MAG: transglutaminase domain-containing protein [Xanthomonadales bacterium]|jgi:tetratricopeptide (TPR) repeat protein|nr:transglutaminase domain-containing protein [Xanthomonadales bacterium]